MSKKIKELKDKDLKDLFAATDTIPNHTKKEAKASASSGSSKDRKEATAAASAAGTTSGETGSSTTKKKEHHKDGSGHHGSHHHRDHHGSSSHSHKADKDHNKQKRRNSEVHPDGLSDGLSGPKAAKMAKTEIIANVSGIANDNSGGIMKKKPEELKMGRIPKIKKPPGSELNNSGSSSANINNDHKLSKELKIKEEGGHRDGHKSSKSKDSKDKSSSKLNKINKGDQGIGGDNQKSHSKSSSKKRPHHSR